MNKKLCSLIYYLIKRVPNLINTKIVKLIYLSDYNFYKYFGSSITGIVYNYHYHGPFSKSIYDCIDELVQNNIIKKGKNISLWKLRTYYLYSILDNYEFKRNLTNQEIDILEYIISEYGRLDYEELKNISYKTEPMISAKWGDILNFGDIYEYVNKKILEVKKEKGSLKDYKGKPFEPKGSLCDKGFMDYQYKVISNQK